MVRVLFRRRSRGAWRLLLGTENSVALSCEFGATTTSKCAGFDINFTTPSTSSQNGESHPVRMKPYSCGQGDSECTNSP